MRFPTPRPSRHVVTALAVAACLLAVPLVGCGAGTSATTAPPTSTQPPPATSPAGTSSTQSEPATTTTGPTETTAPSGTPPVRDEFSDSTAYALSLGGVSCEGRTLYLVIGASVQTEAEAQQLLREAVPFFGDMQSYFIVQRSDNFEGLEPGWWIVVEAYDASPSLENVEFGRRAFPEAYVTGATVLTSDPIPVYEDRLGL